MRGSIGHVQQQCWRILLVAALGGCAGDGEGLDANGRPVTEGAEVGPLTADFESIQSHVFTPICSGCHAGGSAPQGLRLDAANSYLLLVGAPSTEAPGVLRVQPGDPDNSYLVQKLEGRAAVGARMPLGAPPLPSETIAVIRQWISDGALRTPSGASTSFTVTAAVPATGDVLTMASAPLLIEFSESLDASRADASTVRLRAAACDCEVPITAARSAMNPRALIVTPRTQLPKGRYELVTGGEGGALQSESGQPLDRSAAPIELTVFEVESN